MFRSARWRSEKNKVKVVFKLQFHATQVSQFSADALMVSLIPADVGKPTVKSDKAMVRNETCRWENPVYETVKFNREPRTGKISERIYYVHVSNGSSKAGSIGEVSIDFADYAEATKPSSASFPLKNPNSDAVLHVLIQRLHADADQREVEECEDAKIKSENRSLKTFLSHGDEDENVANDTTEDGPSNKTTHDADLNCNCRASIGSDTTLSNSESSSGLDTPRELGLRNSNIHQDPSSFLSSVSHSSLPHEQAANASMTVYDEEWSGSSDHGISTDDSTHSSHNTLSRERSEQASDTEMEKLKAELVALARQADVSELELQTLRKQIVKESKRGQDLSREIANIKDERDALKSECEKLKAFHKRMDEAKAKNKLQSNGGDVRALAEEIRQELAYEKDLNANLRLQLHKTQESNAELILAVRDLDEMLEAKNRQTPDLSNKIGSCENAEELKVNLLKCETDDDDEEQKALEELVKEHGDAKETYLLERKIIDLYGEIEIYRRDKDELEMQMEQLALDYEILKQENHDMSYKLEQSQLQEQLKIQYECSSPPTGITQLEAHIESLENELKKQSKEFLDSLATIRDLEMHITSLEEEMEKQAQGFEADLEAVTHAKVKQEQRAIRAEEALQKTRSRNASTAERLQEEFRRLSVQMASTFDANEKVAMKALKEANELRWQKSQLEEILQKVKQELQTVRDDYEARIRELSNQIDMNACQIEQMLVEIDNESKQLEYQKQHGEVVSRAFSEEIEMLKTEIRRLIAENICLSEQKEQEEICRAEFEHMKASIKESEMLVQRENVERNELVNTIALLKKEAEKSLEELSRIRHLKDEKEATVGFLQSEMETLKAQCADLKNSSFEDEVEKEKLRKQIFQLKNDLRKKDDAFTSIEKKLKDSNGRTVSDGAKNTLKNNKSAPVPRGSKEVATLREKIKLLEGEIKLKETSLETSTNSFLMKEKDLQNKIEELENRVEELDQISSFQKVTIDTSGIISNSSVPEEATAADDPMNSTACLPKENESTWSLVKSIDETSSEKELIKDSSISKNDVNLDLIAELASLKKKNDSMESELHEMQERYSEISLKFAEVEGERQKLVMTVRNLKIAMKS
ncbi:myosin-11-like [Juglans microcarpa x Juglans regia]|uniref:myosin-11-like n=1 Tax=Juglans microcarpa x Juglans regia TaxID=2249226 RepID=UPI001B7DE3D9|nr:myosin-11-like [Juglans microcarpa x Juglans regia]